MDCKAAGLCLGVNMTNTISQKEEDNLLPGALKYPPFPNVFGQFINVFYIDAKPFCASRGNG
jgi:hypothetical protein